MSIQLVIGLGNPGPKYINTRHNLGFCVVDGFIKDAELIRGDEGSVSLWERHMPDPIFFCKPMTYMNRSGGAVKGIMGEFGIGPASIIVICDDFSLPLGRIRIRKKGSSGGHNGLESVIGSIGTDGFPRLRMGVGPVPGGMEPADFVLDHFARGEEGAVKEMTASASDAVACIIDNGIDAAMNRYNAG